MAISDLLWACPGCGLDRGLQRAGKGAHACTGCGLVLERGPSATIRGTWADGRVESLEARDWVERLPELETLFGREFLREARVTARAVARNENLYGQEGFLNRIERFGEETPGKLELRPKELRLEPEQGPLREWPLETLTAVQASSRALQIKVRDEPLVSFQFLDDSVHLWEALLQETLRRLYRETGRGEILEFQPRIVGPRDFGHRSHPGRADDTSSGHSADESRSGQSQ